MSCGSSTTPACPARRPGKAASDVPFFIALTILAGSYVVLIAAFIAADVLFTSPGHLLAALRSPEIRYSIRLSLVSCSIAAILSVWVAVPLGYLLSRAHLVSGGLTRRPITARLVQMMRAIVDTIVDIPIVLPPLVTGLSLLILFQAAPLRQLQRIFPVTYAVPAVVIAQFAVACAFAVRTMTVTFAQISPRTEQVALTLGCTRRQAFWMVALPEARRGILAATTLAWARSLGEFGPILVFAGATRMRTEVLSTTVFLELSIGNLEAAIAVSLMMIIAAVAVLVLLRLAEAAEPFWRSVA